MTGEAWYCVITIRVTPGCPRRVRFHRLHLSTRSFLPTSARGDVLIARSPRDYPVGVKRRAGFACWFNPGHPDYEPGYAAAIRDLAQPGGVVGIHPAERPDVPEAFSLLKSMRGCHFRALDTNCGCAGARCGLRHGSIVSYVRLLRLPTRVWEQP